MIRIPLALLAEYAMAHQSDGRLYVIGGGIREMYFPIFPATTLRLALALGIEVSGLDLGIPHTLTIEASGPTNDPIVKPLLINFTVPPPHGDMTSAGYVHFVSNMDNVSFAAEGLYAFAISIDGGNVEKVSLRAVLRAGQDVSDAMASASLLAQGYNAFAAGAVEAAKELFREVVRRFPTIPGGHNNLGFVLLSEGDADGALEAFLKARELGYEQTEIGQANIAAATYLKGDARAALDGFAACLEEIFRVGATLFGIKADELFPIGLQSAAEYVSLMHLNAAWSAMRLGDRKLVSHHLTGARSSELPTRGDAGGNVFAQSVALLEQAAKA